MFLKKCLLVFSMIVLLTQYLHAGDLYRLGLYQVNLKKADDSLNCRALPIINSKIVMSYRNQQEVLVKEEISAKRRWFKTSDNCYVRAHERYLTYSPKNNPLYLAMGQLRYFKYYSGSDITISMVPFDGMRENATDVQITITQYGLMDDSVAGERSVFTYKKSVEDGLWKQTGREDYYKCVRGKDTQNYSKRRCP